MVSTLLCRLQQYKCVIESGDVQVSLVVNKTMSYLRKFTIL